MLNWGGEGGILGFRHMWNNTISFYIFFKENGKKLICRDHTKVGDIYFLLFFAKFDLIVFED